VIERVIILVEAPLSQRDYERFGLAYMAMHGLNTEVWEIHDVYAPRPKRERVNRAPGARIRRFASEHELVRSASSLKAQDCVVATIGVFSGQERTMGPLIEAIGSSDALFTALSSGHRLPLPPLTTQERTRLNGIAARVRQLSSDLVNNPRRVPIAIRSGWRRRKRQDRTHAAVLHAVWSGTTTDGIASTLINADTQIAYIHTLDYDLVRHARELPIGPASGKIVYLDTMGPEHPDFAVHGMEVLTSPDTWFAEVRNAFDKIEEALHLPIAIVAHPRASQVRLEGWYGDREILTGPTAQSIRDASLTLVTSATTSLGMVACLGRPCLALRTPMIHTAHLAELDAYADALSIPLIDYTAVNQALVIPSPDQVKQNLFVEEFVKRSGTPEQDFWDYVAGRIASWES